MKNCSKCGQPLPDAPQPLTDRQKAALVMIRQHIQKKGVAPCYKQIGRALGVRSSATVYDLVHALERKGWLVTTGRQQGIILRGGHG